MDRLKNFLECSVCLEQYEDPKLLICGHHFCRECIEDLVVLDRKDGTGVITCPLRCDAKTNLTKDQTVNDLVPSYDFKNIVDTMLQEDAPLKPERTCKKIKDCERKVSVFCCKVLMCSECHSKHTKDEAHRSNLNFRKNIPVVFSRRHNKFQVWCSEHKSGCTHLCMDHTSLCRYCLRRNEVHKTHVKKSVENEVSSLREALKNKLKEIEQLRSFYDATVAYWESRGNKVNEMAERLILTNITLNDMSKGGKTDASKLFRELSESNERLFKEHLHQYGRISSLSSSFYQDFLKESDVGVILGKSVIMKKIRDTAVPSSLEVERLSLSPSSSAEDLVGSWGREKVRLISLGAPVVTTLSFDTEGIAKEIERSKMRLSDEKIAGRKGTRRFGDEVFFPSQRNIHSQGSTSSVPLKSKAKKKKRTKDKKGNLGTDCVVFLEDENGRLLGTAKGTLRRKPGLDIDTTVTIAECFAVYDDRKCVECDRVMRQITFQSTVFNHDPFSLFLHYSSSCCGRNLPVDEFPVKFHYKMCHKMIHRNKRLYGQYDIVDTFDPCEVGSCWAAESEAKSDNTTKMKAIVARIAIFLKVAITEPMRWIWSIFSVLIFLYVASWFFIPLLLLLAVVAIVAIFIKCAFSEPMRWIEQLQIKALFNVLIISIVALWFFI